MEITTHISCFRYIFIAIRYLVYLFWTNKLGQLYEVNYIVCYSGYVTFITANLAAYPDKGRVWLYCSFIYLVISVGVIK